MDFSDSWSAVFRPEKGTSYFDCAARIPFERTGDFSVANAWWLAELSRWIYNVDGAPGHGRRAQQRYLDAGELVETTFLSSRGTHCSLVRSASGAFAVLVFRGSSEPRNWITNAQTLPSRDHVHSGYRRAVDQIWPALRVAATGLDDTSLFVTGHSMGAALAVIAAGRLQPVAVYTFGSPKIGTRRFTETFPAIPVYRCVNHRDAAPGAPFLRHFHHVGDLKYLSASRELWHRPDLSRVKADQRHAANRPRHLIRLPDAFVDHAPVNYVACFERLALAR